MGSCSVSRRARRARYKHVIEFAELEEFQELKLKNYSSGMQVRLAFSVAIQVDADVLLVDEVLAVGDAAFQQKCYDVFNRLRDEGTTIVLVTHDMNAVNRFCNRAVLLERGKAVAQGEPEDVANRYLELNFNRDAPEPVAGAERSGNGAARIVDVWCEAQDGTQSAMYLQGQELRFCARVEFLEEAEDPGLTVQFENDLSVKVLVASTAVDHERSGRFATGEEAVFSVAFTNVLAPGRYFPIVTVSRLGRDLEILDRSARQMSIVIQGSAAQGGVVDLPVHAAIERSPSSDRRHAEVG